MVMPTLIVAIHQKNAPPVIIHLATAVANTPTMNLTPIINQQRQEIREILNNRVHPLYHDDARADLENLVFNTAHAVHEATVAETKHIKGLLRELYAVVKGESPRLLDEDCGGNAELDLAILTALTDQKITKEDGVDLSE